MEETKDDVNLEVSKNEGINGDDVTVTEVKEKELAKNKETTDKVLEKLKDEVNKIDWDKVVFEDEEKLIPRVTDENVEIFEGITSQFAGEMGIKSWISIAKTEIEEYKEMMKRESELDKDELKYFNNLKDSVQSSKELLALIQIDAIKMEKDFSENKIAETAIKASVIQTFHNFIIDRYPIIDNKNEVIHKYEDEMKKYSFLIPIFNQCQDRVCKKHAFWDKDAVENAAFNYTCAISTYVKMLKGSDNIDISSIISHDFEYMNFFTVIILYSIIKHDRDSEFAKNILKNIDEKTEKTLDGTLSLYGILGSLEFNDVNSLVKECIKNLSKKEIVESLKSKYLDVLLDDKTFMTYCYDQGTHNLKEPEVILKDLVLNIPQIVDDKIGPWARYYRIIRVLNMYLAFNDMSKVIDKGENTEEAAFNVLLKIVKDRYDYLFTSFVTDFNTFIKETVNAKDSRDLFFKTSMNFINIMHTFCFKSSFTEEETHEEGYIYKVAKRVMGQKNFDNTVVDESEDVMLKELNVQQTKTEYIKTVKNVLSSIKNDLISLS